jgi:hypothetical protein
MAQKILLKNPWKLLATIKMQQFLRLMVSTSSKLTCLDNKAHVAGIIVFFGIIRSIKGMHIWKLET